MTPPLRLLVAHPDRDTEQAWQAALCTALPEASVEAWQPDSAPADYAVGWAVPAALFATQPALKAFFCAGAGVDDLLSSPEVPPQLPLLRIEDAGMGEQMADYCSAAVLGWFTRGADYARQQTQGQWRELPLQQRADWPIGVFGLGALGQVVVRRFEQLGFPVQGCSRSLLASGVVTLEAFLRRSRVLILLAPLTAQTRGLFTAQRLAWLPPGACLINVARGALVDEAALLAALDSGQLAAAQLDVFAHEPLPAAHPFWQHPRVRVTPHTAAYTVIGPAAIQIAQRIRLLAQGRDVQSLAGWVRRDRGY